MEGDTWHLDATTGLRRRETDRLSLTPITDEEVVRQRAELARRFGPPTELPTLTPEGLRRLEEALAMGRAGQGPVLPTPVLPSVSRPSVFARLRTRFAAWWAR